MKLIAFYLPQYHPIPENDFWWGKGFTEWANVAKARPLFTGHYQPRLPADLGFYDLRVPEIREQQAQLARDYGIYGFCYYYYWFNGRRLLERPLEEMIRSKRPEFPFCICWANESWTRTWDGRSKNVLIPQVHTPESDMRFILDVLPILEDERYIRIHNRPLLLVYRTELFPDIHRTVDAWRHAAAQRGINLYLCCVESFAAVHPAEIGFDAACEFPPNGLGIDSEHNLHLDFNLPHRETFSGRIYQYAKLIRFLESRLDPPYKRFHGVLPSWDNTPRAGSRGQFILNTTPDLFRHLLSSAIRRTKQRFEEEEQIVFINAWNEWAEGAYLEPDAVYGHGFLESCRLALQSAETPVDVDQWETFVPYSRG
jgi:lipopolysaccharide biosynthesis protein